MSADGPFRNFGMVPGHPPVRRPRPAARKRPDDSEDIIHRITRVFAVEQVPFRNQPVNIPMSASDRTYAPTSRTPKQVDRRRQGGPPAFSAASRAGASPALKTK